MQLLCLQERCSCGVKRFLHSVLDTRLLPPACCCLSVLFCSCDLQDDFLLGIGQLKQLESLDLHSNGLRHGGCLAPLPPNLTALRLSGNPTPGWRGDFPALDVTPIFARRPVEASSTATNHGQQDADAATCTSPASSLQLQNIYGLHLLDPGVLCGLTRLTALHAGCVYSRQSLAMLTAIQSLPQMRSVDLSVRKTRNGPYMNE